MNRKGYWLGFIFIAALTILMYGTLTVGNLNILSEPYYLTVKFERVTGLKKGDDIRVEGVVMGKVESVKLDEKTGVVVKCRLDRKIALYQDRRVVVEAFSILGGTYVSITRGTIEPALAEPVEVLIGISPAGPLEALSKAVEENRDDLRKVMTNVRDTFGETKKLVEGINKGEGTLGGLVKDRALYEEARGAVAELHKAAGDIKEATANMRQITEKINTGQGTLSKLINSSELHDDILKTINDVRDEAKKAVGEITKAAEGAKDAMQRVNSGEGLVARALNDKKVADDFAATVEKLRSITINLDQISGKIARGEGTVGKLVQDDTIAELAKKALNDLHKGFGRAANAVVYLGLDHTQFFETEESIQRLFFRIEPDKTKFFQIGVSVINLVADAEPITFDEQINKGRDQTYFKVDLALAYKIPWFFNNHVGIRAGAFQGKPGGALDVDFNLLGHEFFVTFEIRDAYNSVDREDIDENVDACMTYLSLKTPLWNAQPTEWWQQILYALKATVGVSRLHDDPEFAVGIGLEYSDEDLRTLLGLISTAK